MRLEEVLKRSPGVFTRYNIGTVFSPIFLSAELYDLVVGKIDKLGLSLKDLYNTERSFEFTCKDGLISCDIVGRGEWICRHEKNIAVVIQKLDEYLDNNFE